MPAKDFYHEHVKTALINDGWEITDDPLKLKWKKRPVYIDLGAQREDLLAARKGGAKNRCRNQKFSQPFFAGRFIRCARPIFSLRHGFSASGAGAHALSRPA